ncbi:4'-phosphopantetheinyl transferase superfamily protein [Streptomyces sp. RKND-216]|uniref:4'-phosphopantetheinyl transferase family protein n=1 Tax=Streptomyces sp. RKND-216 TaxID=2562581 RepID=UPI00109E1E9C|nr:4'-phosphopantetheinyl transferase superfamily protein [Streptomyces sp. RKND-216]THA26319.1 4'-phosphopantetheinyl transferase superfamily protein [Streptomyces sp. RKND-216]
MIEQILPTHVATFDTFHDRPDAYLFPEERALIRDSVESRRREFTTGRHCARTALTRLGVATPQPLPRGPRGAVTWPAGVTGTITHCRGYRAAAVADVSRTVSLGIDAEPDAPLPEGVLEAVALPEEQVAVKELLGDLPAVHWDKLLFSAKESVYKTWFPMMRRPLEFEDALITFDPADGEFTARLLPHAVRGISGAPEEFTGRWAAAHGLLVTAIAFPARVPAGLGVGTGRDARRAGDEVFA